jgi:hypothetical protein
VKLCGRTDAGARSALASASLIGALWGPAGEGPALWGLDGMQLWPVQVGNVRFAGAVVFCPFLERRSVIRVSGSDFRGADFAAPRGSSSSKSAKSAVVDVE